MTIRHKGGHRLTPEVATMVTAFITGGLSLIGVIITSIVSNSNIRHQLDKHQAVQDERIKNLTEAVERHNSFAQVIPKLEQKLDDLTSRVDRLEEEK